MFELNNELEISENIDYMLEKMCERDEYNCTGYTGCRVNGCSVDDSGYLSGLLL